MSNDKANATSPNSAELKQSMTSRSSYKPVSVSIKTAGGDVITFCPTSSVLTSG